jgi:hypothetical protein
LADRGYTASQKLIGRLLRGLGFSLQANKKTLEGATHPDRDAQFEHINQKIKDFQSTSQPAISVDTKKGAGRRLQEWRTRTAAEGKAASGAGSRFPNP